MVTTGAVSTDATELSVIWLTGAVADDATALSCTDADAVDDADSATALLDSAAFAALPLLLLPPG